MLHIQIPIFLYGNNRRLYKLKKLEQLSCLVWFHHYTMIRYDKKYIAHNCNQPKNIIA